MSRHVSEKTYQRFRSYLTDNLDSHGSFSISHSQAVKELAMARSTFQLCVKRMQERDDEWEIISGGNKHGESFTTITEYRYLGK